MLYFVLELIDSAATDTLEEGKIITDVEQCAADIVGLSLRVLNSHTSTFQGFRNHFVDALPNPRVRNQSDEEATRDR